VLLLRKRERWTEVQVLSRDGLIILRRRILSRDGLIILKNTGNSIQKKNPNKLKISK
jgi:hypothetical protein